MKQRMRLLITFAKEVACVFPIIVGSGIQIVRRVGFIIPLMTCGGILHLIVEQRFIFRSELKQFCLENLRLRAKCRAYVSR